ncbi:VQ motif-containing protein 1-like [Punica granatum]|nr:VQ motif-containing protein 1-like [Punica granatum]OWM88545.1 hypothetical protein CDL15_Pgr002312 [Punica granatum]
MKVVIINTQYVETDATSFKSVVQKLTGKDSVVSDYSSDHPMKNIVSCPHHSRLGLGGAILERNWSIKEFDRLLKEMPPVDELSRLWD